MPLSHYKPIKKNSHLLPLNNVCLLRLSSVLAAGSVLILVNMCACTSCTCDVSPVCHSSSELLKHSAANIQGFYFYWMPEYNTAIQHIADCVGREARHRNQIKHFILVSFQQNKKIKKIKQTFVFIAYCISLCFDNSNSIYVHITLKRP